MRINVTNTNNTTVTNNIILAQTVLNNAYEICGKRIASVPVALMEIDDSYQRILGATVKKLMNTWNNEKCDFLLVSFRDNKFYIIDGQHRYSVAKAKGIASLPCIILTDLTRNDEALKFAGQQDNVNKLTPYDTFKANIACGDESIADVRVDIVIKRICDKHNIIVKKYGNNMGDQKVLRCLTTARGIIQSSTYDGSACLEWIIDLINITNWADISDSYRELIVRTLKTFWIDNNGNRELEQKLVSVMNSTTPEMMINKSKHDYPNCDRGSALNLCLRDMINSVN